MTSQHVSPSATQPCNSSPSYHLEPRGGRPSSGYQNNWWGWVPQVLAMAMQLKQLCKRQYGSRLMTRKSWGISSVLCTKCDSNALLTDHELFRSSQFHKLLYWLSCVFTSPWPQEKWSWILNVLFLHGSHPCSLSNLVFLLLWKVLSVSGSDCWPDKVRPQHNHHSTHWWASCWPPRVLAFCSLTS